MAQDGREIAGRLPSVPQRICGAICQACDSQIRDDWCVDDGCGGWVELRHWRAGAGDLVHEALSDAEYDALLEWLEAERATH